MADSNSKGSTAKGTSGAAKRSSAAKSRAKPASASRASRASNGSGATKRSASSSGRAKSSSSNARPKTTRASGRAKSTAASGRSSRSTASSRSSTPARASSNGSQNGNGIVGSVKHVADKAKGPAIAVGAAAAGIAGGIALKARGRRKTVLGIPVPKNMASVDAKSLAKTVGEASARFAKTSKSVSKDLERAGDQAERIGKILK